MCFFNDVCLGFTLGTFKLACAVFERGEREIFSRLLLFIR